MKLEVGMWARTYVGIEKILEIIPKEKTDDLISMVLTDMSKKAGIRIPEHYIKKSSFNIIDLIEVGDFVNGYKVIDLYNEQVGSGNTITAVRIYKKQSGYMMNDLIMNDNIKEILTKEQYEANCYKVEKVSDGE